MKRVLILAVIYQVVSGLPKPDSNYQAPPSLAESQGSTKITPHNLPSNQSQLDSHTVIARQSEITTPILKKDTKSEETTTKIISTVITTETPTTTVLTTTTTKTLLDRIREMFQQSRKKFEESLLPKTTTPTSATTSNVGK